jgi:hypothetical protein
MKNNDKNKATTKLLCDLDSLNCDYGEEPSYVAPGEAGEVVRKMNQRQSAHNVGIVKHENGSLALRWERAIPSEDYPTPENEWCELPLTRQEALAFAVAVTAPDAFGFADEFQLEIDALWPRA